MSPSHLWVDKDRVISVRDKGQILWALRDIREALAAGHGPHTAGALFVQIAEKVVRDLEPLIDEIEEDIENLDEMLSETPRAEIRAWPKHDPPPFDQAAPLDRAPARGALPAAARGSELAGARENVRLREVADRLLRYIESLESARDRATILHDDLTSLVSEQIGRNSYRLTAVAAVLLPPTLITGMFGQNLGGLWGNQHEWAFTIAAILELLMMPAAYFLLRRIGWL